MTSSSTLTWMILMISDLSEIGGAVPKSYEEQLSHYICVEWLKLLRSIAPRYSSVHYQCIASFYYKQKTLCTMTSTSVHRKRGEAVNDCASRSL